MNDIIIGSDFKEELIFRIKACSPSHVFIITDTNVAPLYASDVKELIEKSGFTTHVLAFSAGEQHKTRKTKEFLEDKMLKQGASRQAVVVGLGGGVVLDMAGFVAATYARGIPLFFIPTTLLAMCDAAIGGKNGVNVEYGKNLIGTLYQPKAIFIDPSYLDTLPVDEYKNGIVELIKHGAILDINYFEFLEQNAQKILNKESDTLVEAISRSIAIKLQVVQEDECEQGKRRLLNFGHTIGHAVEQVSGYTIAHGRAVAYGMVIESQLAKASKDVIDRLQALLAAFGVDVSFSYSLEALSHALCLDKKVQDGAVRIVQLEEIGACKTFNGAYCSAITL